MRIRGAVCDDRVIDAQETELRGITVPLILAKLRNGRGQCFQYLRGGGALGVFP